MSVPYILYHFYFATGLPEEDGHDLVCLGVVRCMAWYDVMWLGMVRSVEAIAFQLTWGIIVLDRMEMQGYMQKAWPRKKVLQRP